MKPLRIQVLLTYQCEKCGLPFTLTDDDVQSTYYVYRCVCGRIHQVSRVDEVNVYLTYTDEDQPHHTGEAVKILRACGYSLKESRELLVGIDSSLKPEVQAKQALRKV